MTEGLRNAAVGLVVLGGIFVPLERAFTARTQPHLRRELRLDFAFFLFQYLVIAWVLLAANHALQVRLGPLGPRALVDAVHRLPATLQVALVIVLGDVLVYWAHRLSHAVPLLWRFQSVHHSVETLDWLAAHREHPLDGLSASSSSTCPRVCSASTSRRRCRCSCCVASGRC